MRRRRPARTRHRSSAGSSPARRCRRRCARNLAERGVAVKQCYAVAEAGVISYESDALEGMIVNEDMILEIVRPGTGDPVAEGEVGEVVVTTFNPRLSDDPACDRRHVGGAGRASRPAGAPTRASRAGWAAPTRPPRSRACSCGPSRSPRSRSATRSSTRVRLVVTREAEQDAMTLHAECAAPSDGFEADDRRDAAGRDQAQGCGEARRARQPAERRQGHRRRAAGGLTAVPASAAEPAAEEAALLRLRPCFVRLRPAEPAPAAACLLLLLLRFAARTRRALLRRGRDSGRCRCAAASRHRGLWRLDRIGGSAPVAVTMSRRGQAKSSARPAGASSGSPFTSTRVTTESAGGRSHRRRAEQRVAGSLRCGQRHDRACGRARRQPRRGRGRRRLRVRLGLLRQRRCDRRHARHHPADFAFGIMRELARTGAGEVRAVAGPQAPRLTFEVGTIIVVSVGLRRRTRPRCRCR